MTEPPFTQAIPADPSHGDAASDNAHAAVAALPGPPRPITPRVRRRAWAEPSVRALAVAAMAASLVCAYFLASRYLQWRREAWLISHGTRVNAVVAEAGGITLANKVVPPATPVTLEYEVGGRKVTVRGNLKGRKEHILTGGTVPIRVHPNDPETWTALPAPRSLRMELLAALIVLPFAVLLGVIAWVLQRKVLGLWRDGVATEAVVIDSGHTAIAPRTHLVRCTPVNGEDKRLLQAYLPGGQRPRQGDAVWLIARPGLGTRAVSVEWFR